MTRLRPYHVTMMVLINVNGDFEMVPEVHIGARVERRDMWAEHQFEVPVNTYLYTL